MFSFASRLATSAKTKLSHPETRIPVRRSRPAAAVTSLSLRDSKPQPTQTSLSFVAVGGREEVMPRLQGFARRYWPVLAVAAAITLAVALLPSRSSDQHDEVGATSRREGHSGTGTIAGPAESAAEPGPAAGAGTGTAGRTRRPTRPGSGSVTQPHRIEGASADAPAHCVAGRQFDPAIDAAAPPCAPRWSAANGGATYPGVTDDEILLLDYWIDPGAAPSTFFRAQDIYTSADQQRRFGKAAEKFINSHYELYGRKVRIELWESSCSTQPPTATCFRDEAAQIALDVKPFAVVNSAVFPMSFFFDELSQRKVVNLGGWQLPESFSQARAPYHWDPNIGGTRMAQVFGEWYCNQLHPYPVRYAGEPQPPARSFNGDPRVLGVVTFDDPELRALVEDVLAPALERCGAEIAHTVYLVPNLATANTQNQAAITTMQSPPTATSLLCICAPAMAQFHAAMQQRNYYPEQLMPGNAMTDLDSVAQSFSGPLGCPSGSNCQADNMIGLSQYGASVPRFAGSGTRVWKAAGYEGNPPYPRVDVDWTYWNMLASLIQAAGPDLTPAALQSGASSLGFTGGGDTGQPLRGFPAGVHSWIQDMRTVYWSTVTPSPYNDLAGSWVQMGPRLIPGRVPAREFVAPDKPR